MCGFVGMVLNPQATAPGVGPDPATLEDCAKQATNTLTRLAASPVIDGAIANAVSEAEALGRKLVHFTGFRAAARSKSLRSELKALDQAATTAAEALDAVNGSASEAQALGMTVRLRDLAWRVREDVLAQIPRVRNLAGDTRLSHKTPLLRELWRLDVILANLGRLEVRGRDSSGVSVLVGFTKPEARADFDRAVSAASLDAELSRRRDQIHDFTSGALLEVLPGCPAAVAPPGGALAFTHKVAREVGELGQNVRDLRAAISADRLLHLALNLGSTVDAFGHTRWASNGVVSTPNAHPLSNETDPPQPAGSRPLILAALNGDIDNHGDLDRDLRKRTGRGASELITTDAKLIPLAIDAELNTDTKPADNGDPVKAALLRAVQRFDGSTAIVTQCSATPGRTYLALRGSGQAIHVGLTDEGFIYASELYGVVERTNRHIQLDGRRGEVFVLDALTPDDSGDHRGMRACDYEGAPIAGADLAIRKAEITTRDIDRRGYDHFLLKEVEESPDSVRRTLHGKVTADHRVVLGEETVPAELRKRLAEGQVRAVLVIGQGTAAIAGRGVAAIMQRDLNALGIPIRTMLATELSGYRLDSLGPGTLVVAVSQSGTTTDTNRAVDLARDRGALVIAIVNRRGSDLTTKADGVLYTSDGRDIEMSVASTKAFYCQVVAGALLSLFLAEETGCIDAQTRSRRVTALSRLPGLLSETLDGLEPGVRKLTARQAPCRRHWAVIGSGVANVAAQEVRIKISELCYRSVSVDSLEDKKHIDLSAEPLILVCAAGLQGAALKDAVKEIAIFKAHRAVPLVIAAREAAERFEDAASGVISVPAPEDLVGEILVNTAAGHVVAYWAARAIDDGSKPLRQMRASVELALGTAITRSPSTSGRWSSNEAEAPWLKPARAALLPQLRQFDEGLTSQQYRAAMEPDTAVRLSLLLRYALGRLPLVDLESDTGIRGGMRDVFEALHATLTVAIDETRRTIDAVKHQAKTVTVGTTRAEEPVTGALGEELAAAGVPLGVMAPRDLAALHALAPLVQSIEGSTLYTLSNLDALGRPQDQSRLQVKTKRGVAASMASRADSGAPLSGTKRLAVRDRRLFLGVGTHDNRTLAILPLLERGVPTGLLLLHLTLLEAAPLDAVLRALLTLGTRYDDLRQAVAERNVAWNDRLLDQLTAPAALLDPVEQLAAQVAVAAALGSRTST